MPPPCYGDCGCAMSTSAIAGPSSPGAGKQLGDDGYYAFNDVHALMAFLATGDQRQVQRILDGLGAASRRPDTNGIMSRDVGSAHGARAVRLRTPGLRGGHRRIAARPALRQSLRRQPCAARSPAAHHHRGGVSRAAGGRWPVRWSARGWRSSRAANSTSACWSACWSSEETRTRAPRRPELFPAWASSGTAVRPSPTRRLRRHC